MRICQVFFEIAAAMVELAESEERLLCATKMF
jgi:hypothetical protein